MSGPRPNSTREPLHRKYPEPPSTGESGWTVACALILFPIGGVLTVLGVVVIYVGIDLVSGKIVNVAADVAADLGGQVVLVIFGATMLVLPMLALWRTVTGRRVAMTTRDRLIAASGFAVMGVLGVGAILSGLFLYRPAAAF